MCTHAETKSKKPMLYHPQTYSIPALNYAIKNYHNRQTKRL